jgi:hypothetical protein
MAVLAVDVTRSDAQNIPFISNYVPKPLAIFNTLNVVPFFELMS